ncbi:MFS transporter [Salipiger sp.]|uniref:MFS transporter n=1 Tax=Salipiger sp. TaxID=2078585 RepID=UPI003A9793B2
MAQFAATKAVLVYVAVFFLTSIALRGGKLLVALGALHLGANAFLVGILAAGFAVMPLILSVPAGRVADRIGPQRPILFGSCAMALALVLPVLYYHLAVLFLCAVLLGLGQIAIQISVHIAVGLISTAEQRSGNYATLTLGVSVAAFVGPLIVGATSDHFGLQPAFAVSAAMAVLIALPALRFSRSIALPPAKARDRKGEHLLDLVKGRALRQVIVMSAVAMTGVELFAFYIPVYGTSIGLSGTTIGMVLAAYAAAAVFVRLGARYLLKGRDEALVLCFAMLVSAGAFALLPVFPNVHALLSLSFLLGLALGLASPLTLSLSYSRAPEGRSGEALGLRITVNKITQIAVPLTFGALGVAFGVATVFWGNAVILLLGGLISAAGLRPRPGGSAE